MVRVLCSGRPNPEFGKALKVPCGSALLLTLFHSECILPMFSFNSYITLCLLYVLLLLILLTQLFTINSRAHCDVIKRTTVSPIARSVTTNSVWCNFHLVTVLLPPLVFISLQTSGKSNKASVDYFG